jgi:carbamoyl-phosphate synthase large subunit
MYSQRQLRVLVFPGGTEVGLEVLKCLRYCKEVVLYSASSQVSNHAAYVFKEHVLIKNVREKGWLEELNGIIHKFRIDYVFPTHDDVIEAVTRCENRIHAKVIASPHATCLKTRSKKAVYELFKETLPLPEVYDDIDAIDHFPVFAKPDIGYGAQDAHFVQNAQMLKGLLVERHNMTVLEYLSGKEYTIDCFSHRKRGLLFASGRERARIRMGTSVHAKPVDEGKNRLFRRYAEIISRELVFWGAWCFQMKEDASGDLKLLEINPRIAGGMAFHRVSGVNFALLSLYEREGRDLRIMTNAFEVEMDRAFVNRYRHSIHYKKIYVDWDDTVVVHDRLNLSLILFLYQAKGKGCQILLITKCLSDIREALQKRNVEGIFDEIIWLKEDDLKSEHIQPDGAIFIDDSFSQRLEVQQRHGIPTFDCSMIEALMDDRE